MRHALILLAAALLSHSLPLAAQAGGAVPSAARRHLVCAPIPPDRGATISFGREGGSIRPRAYAIRADGLITLPAGSAGVDSVGSIAPAAVAGLARLASRGGFWILRSPDIRRPPNNPDAAREFINVALTCGTHRAEYVAGAEPAAFTELYALLSALVGG